MKTSSWIDSAPGRRFGKPDRNLEVDLIVIGGGITGITAAYLAKQAGKTVALIDRAHFAQADTGATTAHLTAMTDLRLQDIAAKFGRDAAKATWNAGAAAIDQIVANIRRETISCDFHWVPGYLHASLRDIDPKKIGELQAEARLAQELDIKAEFLEAVPFFNLPGVKFSHQALFHPLKYLDALLATLPGKGSHVFEETNADEVADDLTVTCGRHKIRGDYLFIATHNPITGKAGVARTASFQTKLALYTSYVLAGKVPKGSMPVASFCDTGSPYDYLRVDRHEDHDYVIFGGEDHKTGQEADTHLPYERLEARLKTFLPRIEIDHRWSGQVIATNDGLPFIGEIAENQFIATGFSGNGMTFGTLGAMMAVDRVIGRGNPWADLFDVNRTKLLGGTWTYLKENKDFPYYFLRDWLASSDGDGVEQLAPGQGKILRLHGKKTAAYRDEKGKVTLCSPVCPHLKCIVDWNDAEKTWDCPCHGSRFQPDGTVISGPAEDPLEPVKL